ncbi:MAG: hypothetical protein J6X44_11805 [Thermoguttaceae bacterium]|nr:hypothetical protein [Thermoguttaceae bacterium]
MKRISDIDEGTIRRIDWQTLVPPTILFRAFSLTFKPTFLFLGSALAALCATSVGFRPYSGTYELCGGNWTPCNEDCARLLTSVFPYFTPLQITRPSDGFLVFWLGLLIGAVVAAWFSLAFSRSTVVQLTSSARSSTLASSLFALKKFPSMILPGLLPFGALFAIWFCAFAATKLGVLSQIGAPLFAGAFLLLGTLFLITALAFPLATSAIATENNDCFDATSRGVSYATQRFLFLIMYSFFASILTFVGFVVVEALVELSLIVYESAYFSCLDKPWIMFWRMSLILLPTVYACCSGVAYVNAIYIALRRSVDGTPYDSCVLDLRGRKPRQLSQILHDVKGAPIVAGTEDGSSEPSESKENKD